MYVGGVMHTNLVTVSPETSLVDAMDLIKEKKIAHLLVVDKNNKLIGLVTDRDLKQNWASPATTLSAHELNYLLTRVTLSMIMMRKIVTVTPQTTIERAALMMQENRIGGLPVMEGDQLVGIITTTDVMGVLLQAIGIDKESLRFTVLVQDRVGFIADVSRILKDNLINIRSVFAWPDQHYSGIYHMVMRVPQRDGEKAVTALRDAGFKVLTEYVKDLSPYMPVG
ncbi:MAG: CBS and ACT domain-containing protein [Desulfatirhabdiaceae bacterium]